MALDKNFGAKTLSINGNELPLSLASDYKVYNTKTYVTSPLRSNDGSMGNINDYDVFFVPRIMIEFNFISFEKYMFLMDILNSANEYWITYFDIDTSQYVQDKFYITPEESEKLLYVEGNVKGVQNLSLSFVGTLNNTRTSKITFLDESGSLISIANPTYGELVDLSTLVTIPNFNEDYSYKWKDTTTEVYYYYDASIIPHKRAYRLQLVIEEE